MLPRKGMLCFPVFEDNQGAVQLAQNSMTNSNSKHIAVRHHFRENTFTKEIFQLHTFPPSIDTQTFY